MAGKPPKRRRIWWGIVVPLFALVALAALNTFHVFGNTDSLWWEDSIKILFVGNSHVYTGNVPRQLKAIAVAGGAATSYRDISTHGASLAASMERAVEEMKSGVFDYVILQDQGRRPVNNPEGFFSDVKALCDAARENGAAPVLYNPGFLNTNGLPDRERQEPISEAYRKAAEDNGVPLVNAADAWIYAYDNVPGISLYRQWDIRGPHASDEGAYYAACLFAAALFDVRLEDGHAAHLNDDGNAEALAEAAWEFLYYDANTARMER